jgi:hypothetical protein
MTTETQIKHTNLVDAVLGKIIDHKRQVLEVKLFCYPKLPARFEKDIALLGSSDSLSRFEDEMYTIDWSNRATIFLKNLESVKEQLKEENCSVYVSDLEVSYLILGGVDEFNLDLRNKKIDWVDNSFPENLKKFRGYKMKTCYSECQEQCGNFAEFCLYNAIHNLEVNGQHPFRAE